VAEPGGLRSSGSLLHCQGGYLLPQMGHLLAVAQALVGGHLQDLRLLSRQPLR